MELEILKTLRTDFLSFCALVARDIDGLSIGGQPYIQRLAYILTKVREGELDHLVLRAPPRHFKSKLAAAFTAFELGHNPRLEGVWASYDEPIAAETVDYVRDILRLPWYSEVFPHTHLNLEHSRSGDFRTTKGGGLRAIGIHGKIAAKGIDLFIADDVLDIEDWNNQSEMEEVIKRLERIVPSRFNTPTKSRAIILGHLLNFDDPGSHFVKKGWALESLPFEGVADQDIELGHGVWHRKTGELLRPDAYSDSVVAELRQKVDPPWDRYFQQGEGRSPTVFKASDFRMCERGRHGNEPIVLSVDTALRSGARHSYNLIQAWAFDGKNHFLREQFREHCSYEVLEATFCKMVKKLRCYAAIIEETANGPPLIRCAEGLDILVISVKPTGSKADRLAAHSAIIRQGRVYIARHLYPEFTDEIDNLPRSGTDQADGCSQYLAKRPPSPPAQLQSPCSVPAMALASHAQHNPASRIVNGIAISLGSSTRSYAPPQGSGWHTLRSSRIA